MRANGWKMLVDGGRDEEKRFTLNLVAESVWLQRLRAWVMSAKNTREVVSYRDQLFHLNSSTSLPPPSTFTSLRVQKSGFLSVPPSRIRLFELTHLSTTRTSKKQTRQS